ncbi:hypothetical protein GCM10020001_102520 [Nonomuraea salmonea]
MAGFEPGELDVAFAERKVVKGTLLRVRLHAVQADGHTHIHKAMQPTLRGTSAR